ncbi:Aminotransferase class IV [Frankia sp. Hr75.2]|nr:Aminotransferase class IV [Frankia sp. Hr75.2]
MGSVDMTPLTHVEVDGHPAGVDDLRHLALANDGHLTTMQVRAGRVRGLALHLRRLDRANQELYGTYLDGGLVRDRIRHALATTPAPHGPAESGDATVRTVVFPTGTGSVSILVSIGPPAEPAAGPLRLCSLRYQRPFPHIKHVGSFGQIHFGRLARGRGFDDALLVTGEGLVCETTVANIGFVTAAPARVIWPDGPSLVGVTMALLDERLRPGATAEPVAHQVPAAAAAAAVTAPDTATIVPAAAAGEERGPLLESRREPVRLADVGHFRAAFVANARGIVPVDRIDTTPVPVNETALAALRRAYASVPWDEI